MQIDRWVRAAWAVIAIAVLSGVGLRCADLGRQIYTGDEVWTSLRVAGYSDAELDRRFFDERVHTVAEWQTRLQAPNPEKPPLYYGATYLWTKAFGASPARFAPWPR